MKTDICLILEGTYPYVHGGVSSWIHHLVNSLSDFTFSIVHLSSTGDIIRSPKYDIPPNILEFREAFIHDFSDDKSKGHGSKKTAWKAIKTFYQDLDKEDFSNMELVYDLIIDKRKRALNVHDLIFSRDSWKMMVDLYNAVAPDVSFIDFYWTIRFIHIPLLNIINIDIPEASIYHTICTGYAGLLSVIAKISKKAPMILTEHGIYTHERKIDISQADWIYTKVPSSMRATKSLGFFKDFWIKKFEILSKMTYQYADRIVTLFEGNRHMQIDGGADPYKTLIIPNGVVLPEGAGEVSPKKGKAKTVGFVGRIVSIKDIKTFIRAMKIVKEKFDDVVIYIMGSGEEDQEYYDECRVLTEMLQLEDNVIFTGIVDVKDYYPVLDTVVLTSVSEGQPLSVLEAMSYGVPVVSTDVGSCAELLQGRDARDKSLGSAGIITNVGNPYETANAVISILENDDLRKQMSETGLERVKKHYTAGEMITKYEDLYRSF